MKKVLFDLWQAQPQNGYKYHGGGEYIKSIFKTFVDCFENKCVLTVFFDSSLFLDEWILDSLKEKRIAIVDVSRISDIQTLLDECSYDVFFSGLPYLYKNIKIPEKTIYVGTIHGLRALELSYDCNAFVYFKTLQSWKLRIKSLFRRTWLKKRKCDLQKCIENMKSVICVSNHTKYAIKNFFPNINKPVVCYYTPPKVLASALEENTEVVSKFILLIGCDRFEKNSYRAIVALNGLFDKGLLPEYKVVTVGKLPNKIERTIKYRDKFVCYNYISTEKLEGLYASCDFFLYPTLNEGFGMPPLEAMKYGKTCIVSGVCSVPEICGDAVYYVNPYDINEIQNRILMASEKKIDLEKISERYRFVSGKQEADLKKVCEHIIGLNEK